MRLLVVEDERKVASFLERGLSEAGHVVDVAYTGADGECLASIEAYDAIILDCLLPDRDGRHVCRSLRAAGIDTPVMLLTALGSSDDKILGFDSGADQYVEKPFHFAELLARLRALVRHDRAPQLGAYTVADLRIEPLSRSVRRSGIEVSLTTKEYLLLELLVRRAGQVVTRTEIIEQVWDMHHDPMTNTVDVLVKHLRDKIDRDFEPKLVETVRGVGYTVRPAPASGEDARSRSACR
jgi:DNA-binding response OmpR family regulator